MSALSMSADQPQADRNLRTALASGDWRSASGLLDGDLTWVNAEGRLFDKAQALEVRPEALLGGDIDVHRYEQLATVRAEAGKRFALRIWVERKDGWRLLVWHEVAQDGQPAPHGAGRKEYDNPCFTLPYAPKSPDEHDCLQSWQQLEVAVMRHDPNEWARHVADEFVVVGAARRHGKADRFAVIAEQRRTNANSAPAPLVSARLDAFGDAMLMRCEHQPFHGKAARVSRVFVRRAGLWQMAASFQTTRQDAPVVTIA